MTMDKEKLEGISEETIESHENNKGEDEDEG